jgi:hypothetical protein
MTVARTERLATLNSKDDLDAAPARHGSGGSDSAAGIGRRAVHADDLRRQPGLLEHRERARRFLVLDELPVDDGG